MNQEFIIKMIMAKKMEYDAIMELVPEQVKKKMNKAGEEAISVIAECFKRSYCDFEYHADYRKNEDSRVKNSDDVKSGDNKSDDKKKVKKINIQ